MIKCEICKKEFTNYPGLSRHIWQKHPISVQEYYDKYFKLPEEGICLITGLPTTFKNLKEGYLKYSGKGSNSKDDKIKDKKKNTYIEKYGVDNPSSINPEKRIKNYRETRKKDRDLKKLRSELIDFLRILSIDKSNKFQCQICGIDLSNMKTPTGHFKFHNLSAIQYYDKYIRKEGEGICPISGQTTTFESFEKGYRIYYLNSFFKNKDHIERNKDLMLQDLKNRIKIKQKSLEIEFTNIDEIKKSSSMASIKCLKCGNIYKNRWYNLVCGFGKCPFCYPKFKDGSKGQNEIFNFIKSIDSSIEVYNNLDGMIKNIETGNSYELDIYIPSYNLAIEYDGLYWHSDAIIKNSNYHITKTKLCNDNGIRLIHIFEDEWLNKRTILEKKIEYLLNKSKSEKIHARKCEIKEIESNIKNSFLDKYHIQGKDQSKIKLGAYYKDELISVMTFSLGNISRGGNPKDELSLELSRFCTNYDYIAVGIASKLLNYFKKNYNWRLIYSYADLRYSNGKLYETLGFEQKYVTSPDYWYVDFNRRIYRYNLRKQYLDENNKTEKEIRKEEGYHRIYDCGKIKYVLKNNQIWSGQTKENNKIEI